MDELKIKEIAEEEAKKELDAGEIEEGSVVQNEAPEIEPEGDTSSEEPEAPVEAPVKAPESQLEETPSQPEALSWTDRLKRLPHG